ncbi:hypothetical protein E0L36_04230 [Streptomyces sp. AJS327]|nr:hypothetical protein [Streptomyces sp. AJS327]
MVGHDGEAEGTAPRDGAGDTALTMGVVALVCAFVPVIGDYVAALTGLLAVVLGVVGIRRSERGAATNFGASFAGAVLGALAILVVALMFAVTR